MSIVEHRFAVLAMRRPARFALVTALTASVLTLAALTAATTGGGALFAYDAVAVGEAP